MPKYNKKNKPSKNISQEILIYLCCIIALSVARNRWSKMCEKTIQEVQIRCPSTTRKTNKTPKYIKQVSVHKRF
jgi:hypothetical protein